MTILNFLTSRLPPLIVRTDLISIYDIINFNTEVFYRLPYILLRYVTGRFAFLPHIKCLVAIVCHKNGFDIFALQTIVGHPVAKETKSCLSANKRQTFRTAFSGF